MRKKIKKANAQTGETPSIAPYIGPGTAQGPTCDVWDIYADIAAKLGYQAGPENFGYLIPTFVAEAEEKAQELGNEDRIKCVCLLAEEVAPAL